MCGCSSCCSRVEWFSCRHLRCGNRRGSDSRCGSRSRGSCVRSGGGVLQLQQHLHQQGTLAAHRTEMQCRCECRTIPLWQQWLSLRCGLMLWLLLVVHGQLLLLLLLRRSEFGLRHQSGVGVIQLVELQPLTNEINQQLSGWIRMECGQTTTRLMAG